MPLIALVGWLLLNSAHAAPASGDPTELAFESETAPAGTFYGIRWSADGAKCEIAEARASKPITWIAAPSERCGQVTAYLKSHQPALDERAGKPRKFGARVPHGALSLGSRKWVARTDTAPSCDATLTHCTQPVLDAPSELCALLRDAVTAQLGRLPPVTH